MAWAGRATKIDPVTSSGLKTTSTAITTTATTGVDIITFYTFNGGSSPVWYGFAAGLDMQ